MFVTDTYCRSDPLLERQKASSPPAGAETRHHHAVTSSEQNTHTTPAAGAASDVPQYRLIDVPPSDYLTKPLAVDEVSRPPMLQYR